MAQGQIQVQKQEQTQKQTQTITQQQLLQAHLVELPINQLIERINTEMDDNPALEAEPAADAHEVDSDPYAESADGTGGEDDFADIFTHNLPLPPQRGDFVPDWRATRPSAGATAKPLHNVIFANSEANSLPCL